MPAKIEGLAFGQDVTVDGEVEHTLYVSNDNDFLSQVPLSDGTLVDNPNQFFVFGFTDADLAKFGVDEFVPQDVAAIPEPSTWAMMIFGFLGLGFIAARRKGGILAHGLTSALGSRSYSTGKGLRPHGAAFFL